MESVFGLSVLGYYRNMADSVKITRYLSNVNDSFLGDENTTVLVKIVVKMIFT